MRESASGELFPLWAEQSAPAELFLLCAPVNNLPNWTERPLGPGSSSDGPWIQEEHQIPNGAQAGRLGPCKITLYKERGTHLRARACQLTCPGPLRMAVLRPPTCRGTSDPEDPPSSEGVRLVPGRASESSV